MAIKIECLRKLDKEKYISLYFYDESHFGLVPCVPYAWQKKGETVELPSFKSGYINVAGFLQPNGDKKCYLFEKQTINAVKLVNIFEDFAKNTKQKTVVILDNAPIHRSKLFQQNIKRWETEYDFYILFLPPYSPELNLIEIFWKKIKYEWLPFRAYKDFQTLKHHLLLITDDVEQKYRINFV